MSKIESLIYYVINDAIKRNNINHEVNNDTSLSFLDELDKIEIAILVENETGHEFEQSEIDDFKTVNHILKIVT